MSITNLLFENQIDLRARKALIGELWTRDSEDVFFRVTPGSGGGDDLPYYLKPNNIQIDDPVIPGSFTNIDQNSVDVTSANYTASLNGNGTFFVKHNNVGTAAFISNNVVNVGYINPGNTAIDTSKDFSIFARSSLSFKNASGSVAFNRDDVILTNQLKALTAATPVGTSKMVTFNTATSSFAHADIPTSVAPYTPKLIKLSGKEWKQGNVSATAGLDFTSRALVAGVYKVDTPTVPVKKQQKRCIQWFYNRKVSGGVTKGPTWPTIFSIPSGTLFPGDIIDLEIFSADANDIISNVDEYAIFIGSPDFSIASLKSLDISATSDNPYLNVTAYPTELAYFSNGVDNSGGVDSFPGIILTYIYNGRDNLTGGTGQHHHLTSFRIQYKGKLMTSVNVTSP